jgi:hypothetical protein
MRRLLAPSRCPFGGLFLYVCMHAFTGNLLDSDMYKCLHVFASPCMLDGSDVPYLGGVRSGSILYCLP